MAGLAMSGSLPPGEVGVGAFSGGSWSLLLSPMAYLLDDVTGSLARELREAAEMLDQCSHGG